MGFGEQEKSKEEEGDEMSRDDVKTVVQQLFNEKEEKSKATGQLSKLGEKVQEAIGQLADLRKLFCNPDGTICFLTKGELDAHMQEQDKQSKELAGKVTTLAEKVETVMHSGKGVAGVEPLEKWGTGQAREDMSQEAWLERDARTSKILKQFNVTDNDAWRVLYEDKANLPGIVKKPDIRQAVFDNVSEQEGKQILMMICKDGRCKPWREGLEKEQGVKLYTKDEKTGKWTWVDQPPKADVSTF